MDVHVCGENENKKNHMYKFYKNQFQGSGYVEIL